MDKKEVDKIEGITKTFENVKINILGKVRTVPSATITKYPDGMIGISVDEYNRIAMALHMKWTRERKERERNGG